MSDQVTKFDEQNFQSPIVEKILDNSSDENEAKYTNSDLSFTPQTLTRFASLDSTKRAIENCKKSKNAPLPALKTRQSEIVKVKPQLKEIHEKQSSIALSNQKKMAPISTLATPTA